MLLAFAVLYPGATLEAAFWLGLVANQQLTVAPFAWGLVAAWFASDRRRFIDWRAWMRALPAIAAPLIRVKSPQGSSAERYGPRGSGISTFRKPAAAYTGFAGTSLTIVPLFGTVRVHGSRHGTLQNDKNLHGFPSLV